MQLALAAVTGACGGLFIGFLSILAGIFISPILSFITISIASLLIFYMGKFLQGRTLSYRKLWTLVFFAHIPFYLIQIVSPLIPIITLFGFASTIYLIYVGLTESHGFAKDSAKKLLVGVLSLFVLIWLWGKWDSSKLEKALKAPHNKAPEVHLGK